MTSRPKTFPAPVRGWVENENLALNQGIGASVAENGFPLTSTVRIRGGDLKVAMVGAAVTSLIPYRSGAAAKLFAATATAVYDISLFDDDTVPAAALSSLTGGEWSSVQVATSGGQFIVMVNGADTGRTYNGTSWSNISLTGVDSADLNHVWLHAERAWFIEAGSMTAWYLPVESIGGTVADFFLGAVFTEGGSLYTGAAWSSDSGSGMADRCVFISTEGEVAVYEGIDPADPLAWFKVGVYRCGRPVSRHVMKAGGDLLIATTEGIVPLSQIMVKDPAALALAAVTQPIEQPWRRFIRGNGAGLPVQMLKWTREGMGIIGFRHRKEAFIVNVQTGAWSLWTNKDIQALTLHNDLAYYGDADGFIYQIEGTGSDDGDAYTFRWSLLPDHLGKSGFLKIVHSARATFRSNAPFEADLDVATDYGREFGPAPDAASISSTPALWDVGQWDVSLWDDGEDSEVRYTATTLWRSINRSGIVVAPQVQITSGSTRKPDAELVVFDLIYEDGGIVV